jgi:hypothetical protein
VKLAIVNVFDSAPTTERAANNESPVDSSGRSADQKRRQQGAEDEEQHDQRPDNSEHGPAGGRGVGRGRDVAEDLDLETVAVRSTRGLDESGGGRGADVVGVLAEVHRRERDVPVSTQLVRAGCGVRRGDTRYAGQTSDLGERRLDGVANRWLGDLFLFRREDDALGVAGDAGRRLLQEALCGGALGA